MSNEKVANLLERDLAELEKLSKGIALKQEILSALNDDLMPDDLMSFGYAADATLKYTSGARTVDLLKLLKPIGLVKLDGFSSVKPESKLQNNEKGEVVFPVSIVNDTYRWWTELAGRTLAIEVSSKDIPSNPFAVIDLRFGDRYEPCSYSWSGGSGLYWARKVVVHKGAMSPLEEIKEKVLHDVQLKLGVAGLNGKQKQVFNIVFALACNQHYDVGSKKADEYLNTQLALAGIPSSLPGFNEIAKTVLSWRPAVLAVLESMKIAPQKVEEWFSTFTERHQNLVTSNQVGEKALISLFFKETGLPGVVHYATIRGTGSGKVLNVGYSIPGTSVSNQWNFPLNASAAAFDLTKLIEYVE